MRKFNTALISHHREHFDRVFKKDNLLNFRKLLRTFQNIAAMWLKFSESHDVSITCHTNCIHMSYQLQHDYKNSNQSTCYFSLKMDWRSPESTHILYENFDLQYTKLTSCLVKPLSISIFSLHIRYLSIYLTIYIYLNSSIIYDFYETLHIGILQEYQSQLHPILVSILFSPYLCFSVRGLGVDELTCKKIILHAVSYLPTLDH